MAYKILEDGQTEPIISKESLHRLPAQAIKGTLASIPGIAGDVAALGHEFIANPLVGALGGEKTPYEKSPLGKILPTTQQHIKNLESGIPYLKPKNKIEQFTQDVASDAMSLFLPGGAIKGTVGLRGANLARSSLVSLGANTAGETVANWTGDPKKGAYTKMGAMFLGSMLNKPGVQREISNMYNEADRILPQNATVNASGLQRNLQNLQNRILVNRQPQDLAPSERFVIDQSDIILRHIQNGQISVPTLRASLRSLNENLERAVYEAPRRERIRARSLATNINRHVNETLADYGRTNPEWWNLFRGANQAHGAMQQSNFVSRYIENNILGHPATHGLVHLLGDISETATSALAPYELTKIAYRMWNSPVLRQHYARVLSSAAAENAPLMNKEIKKLDAALQKEIKNKSKYKLLD